MSEILNGSGYMKVIPPPASPAKMTSRSAPRLLAVILESPQEQMHAVPIKVIFVALSIYVSWGCGAMLYTELEVRAAAIRAAVALDAKVLIIEYPLFEKVYFVKAKNSLPC